METLERRRYLSAAISPTIVLGRTLSSYFAGNLQNNQVTITYTVYNQQASTASDVLVSDTLASGLTLASDSQQPDESGQHLAWNLGSIPGFDRASVSVTVNLPNPIAGQLDNGAQAFAMVNGAAESSSTPAAVLSAGTVDPNLLGATPDTDATDMTDAPSGFIADPIVQEQAAALGYNAQNIFNFLQGNIGYNSYQGSIRGARGTLWSGAGDSLDVASLGVALMRASGIPAQYVSGTLSKAQAQQLILSMFPGQYREVGYVSAGATLSDPVDNPQLLTDAETHYWFEFNTGAGMTSADPLISGSVIGQSFASSASTFTIVPDAARETTEIQLSAELYSVADAAFGSSGLSSSSVLDQTYFDVNLVGRPLSVGNFVTSNIQGGLVFTTATNTYLPYVEIDDEATPGFSTDEVYSGTAYQEVLSNFPLGSTALTGLFLNMTDAGPLGSAQVFTKTLYDAIGIAARQGGGSVSPAINPSGPPALSNLDVWTLNDLPGLQSSAVLGSLAQQLQQLQDQYKVLAPVLNNLPTTEPLSDDQQSAVTEAGTLSREMVIVGNEGMGITFAAASDQSLTLLESGYDSIAYYSLPRLIVASNFQSSTSGSLALDLVCDQSQVIAPPGAGFGRWIWNSRRPRVTWTARSRDRL